jgi:hypothetical protein
MILTARNHLFGFAAGRTKIISIPVCQEILVTNIKHEGQLVILTARIQDFKEDIEIQIRERSFKETFFKGNAKEYAKSFIMELMDPTISKMLTKNG